METAVYDLMERICNLLRSLQREAGAAVGLQPVHMAALAYLERANRYSDTPAGVAEYLGLTKGTVSQSLLVLEREGYIEKEPDGKDKRVVHLRLRGAGRRLVRDNAPPRLFGAAARQLSPADRAALGEYLGRLLREMQRINGSRSFGVCRSCRFFTTESGGRSRCGLTGEALTKADSRRICREHELAKVEVTAPDSG